MALMERNTFEFYGINDCDMIVLVPRPEKPPPIAAYPPGPATDGETIKDKLRQMTQSRDEENARLRDLKLVRMERKPRTFRKLVRSQDDATFPGSWRSFHQTVLADTDPTAPSEDPLPMCWQQPGRTPLFSRNGPFLAVQPDANPDLEREPLPR
jgi:hypothetical protein